MGGKRTGTARCPHGAFTPRRVSTSEGERQNFAPRSLPSAAAFLKPSGEATFSAFAASLRGEAGSCPSWSHYQDAGDKIKQHLPVARQQRQGKPPSLRAASHTSPPRSFSRLLPWVQLQPCANSPGAALQTLLGAERSKGDIHANKTACPGLSREAAGLFGSQGCPGKD